MRFAPGFTGTRNTREAFIFDRTSLTSLFVLKKDKGLPHWEMQ
jgi:hypothetical protein